MASVIKVDTIQSTTSNVFFQNSAGTEYARFDSNGNLGIGGVPPNVLTKFYVEQGIGSNVLGYFNSTATSQNARLRINSTDNASSVAYVWSYSHASLNKQASVYLTGTGALATQVGQTAGSEPTTGTTSAIFNQYGIGLGGTNPSSGTGIAFPATQSASSDANTLDDYEEGTWTPTITSSSGTITSFTSSGFYVKIGKQVTVWCNVKVTNVGTGTGSVSISSMPFTVNATDLFGIVATGRETDVTGSMFQGWTTSGGNGFNVLRYDNNGLIGTNYRYVGSVTYTV